MTIHQTIVKEVLDRPEDFDVGFNGVVLDHSHTLVWCSDSEYANPGHSKQMLDDFIADMETVSSHPKSSFASGEIRNDEGQAIESF